MSKPSQQQLFAADALPPEPMPWETAAARDQLVAQVVFNRPLETAYHYVVPDSLRTMIGPGQRVRVPFGKGDRPILGFCVGVGPPPEISAPLKSIESVIDREPLLSEQMLELTRWIADRYLCGWGQVLHSVVPAGVRSGAGTRLMTFVQPTDQGRAALGREILPPKQQAVLEVLCAATEPMRAEELAEAARCGTGPINALRKRGFLAPIRQRTSSFPGVDETAEPVDDLVLNSDQRRALDEILKLLRAGENRTVLLHGVTGSGKTEVYIQAIREVVSYGRQAIVLVPEISLTPQTIRRFRSRFKSVAVLHSHLSDSERHWQWQRIASGAVQVVVGARSAIFAPTPHLGLIVIDEEHESTFKQETTPRYHARDVARHRAELEGIPLILGSATPTLDSWYRVLQRKDLLLSLPKRVERLPLPPVVVVDVRNDPHCSHGAAIGRALESALRLALNDGGQAILLLNLRGFSPAIWCRACGESVKCPNCDISLTWHRDRKEALCHSCEHSQKPPRECPSCGRPGVEYVGFGTQKLEQEVKARFPEFRCLRMDSDSMRKPGSHDQALEAFHRGEVQILLGTQMIAKGLDFPNVTLVGVVSADTTLHQPDIRSAERTFQLIAQVAGRTGRSAKGGRVFVQTFNPAEPAIIAASEHDYQKFVARELVHRRDMNAPPFHSLVRVVLRGPDEDEVRTTAKEMLTVINSELEQTSAPVQLLGPAPAPIAKLKKNYRYHFQLSAAQLDTVQDLWKRVREKLPHSSTVEYVVDVDPLDMR